ncbi:MAG: hypothetical protein U9R32_05820 [Bacteroidota bacterium]|nr:hypothetical protein [Bacteroidota bacterium]
MKVLNKVSRIFVGIVFIFSGFVKGVDPLGTMYKIEDYFIAYDFQWAIPFALILSFILIAIEFGLGVFLVFRVRMKVSSWLLLLMMSFFTIITLFDALYNPVPDCGCFGEAIKLTNWQTFYKNIFLLVPTLIVFLKWKDVKWNRVYGLKEINSVGLIFLFVVMSVYSYNHLPIIDYRNWEEGKDMSPDDQGEPVCYLVYEDKTTGEKKNYLSEKLPWQDSVWMSNWEFVCQKIDYSAVNRVHDLQIVNEYGDDLTSEILENQNYQFFIVVNEFNSANKSGLKKIVNLWADFEDEVDFVVITSSLEDEIADFKNKYNVDMSVYQADDIILKSMVRSNPGVILLKNGVVIKKWHHNDIPTKKELHQEDVFEK